MIVPSTITTTTTVQPHQEHLKLHHFIRSVFPSLCPSKKQAHHAFQSSQVLLNGCITQSENYRVQLGDVVALVGRDRANVQSFRERRRVIEVYNDFFYIYIYISIYIYICDWSYFIIYVKFMINKSVTDSFLVPD